MTRRMQRSLFAGAALVALYATVPAAQAHVTLETREATLGAPYKAVFKVGHGCNGSPTTRLRVRLPDGVIAAKPMPKPGWQIEIESGPYDKAYAFFHGATLKEGVKTITWTGKLDDKFYDEFVVSVFIADSLKAGDTLYFPVVQDCETGVYRWIETPKAGASSHDLKEPAPGVLLQPKK